MESSHVNKQVRLDQAIKVDRLESNIYRINLSKDFSIGTVPNGGYTASCMLAAANNYLLSRKQQDTLTAHFEYPSRTKAGPAIVVIDPIRVGNEMSTLHLTLWQDGLLDHAPWITPTESRRIVLAYSKHVNLSAVKGISLRTGFEFELSKTAPPRPDFDMLRKNGSDDNWEEPNWPKAIKAVPALQMWHIYMPKGDQITTGVLDMWLRLQGGLPITQEVLAYAADTFPFHLHSYLVAPELRALLRRPLPWGLKPKTIQGEDSNEDPDKQQIALWFPTLCLNLEAKTPLPKQGVEWLFVRVTSKQIKDGKFDMEILLRHADGEIAALVHQVSMIVPIERNIGPRVSKPSL